MGRPIGDDPVRDRIWFDEHNLGEARVWLREQAEAGGANCPCCKRFTKIYKRSLNSRMARALVIMWRRAGTEMVNIPDLSDGGGDPSKLRYWGLIQEERITREDGGRAGWWHVTDKGAAFVNDNLAVPKYALIYDSRLYGLTGPPVAIRDCLGQRFNLDELLAAPAGPLFTDQPIGGR